MTFSYRFPDRFTRVFPRNRATDKAGIINGLYAYLSSSARLAGEYGDRWVQSRRFRLSLSISDLETDLAACSSSHGTIRGEAILAEEAWMERH